MTRKSDLPAGMLTEPEIWIILSHHYLSDLPKRIKRLWIYEVAVDVAKEQIAKLKREGMLK